MYTYGRRTARVLFITSWRAANVGDGDDNSLHVKVYVVFVH